MKVSVRQARKFIFDDISIENDRKLVNFIYQTKFEDTSQLSFTESLEFAESLPESEMIDNALHFYHIAAGVSYYKAHLAPEIASHGLDPWASESMTDIYRNGLGEFMHMNDLRVADVARFEPEHEQVLPTTNKSVMDENWLIPIGGGKDSLTSTTILEQTGQPFRTFRINSNDWVDLQLDEIDVEPVKVKRKFDPFLVSDTPQLKGHVPITVIVAATSIICAVAFGYKAVAFSNESSADEPTLRGYNDEIDINHQWAKSSEAEQLIQHWVHRYISADLEVFSLLRNMSELDIAEIFAKAALPHYSGLWSSSNSNFRHDASGKLDWDLTSPKTCTVFLLLAPFVDREELITEFGGNPLALEENNENWAKLLGKTEVKPFECVATIDEMREALRLAINNWPEAKQLSNQLMLA